MPTYVAFLRAINLGAKRKVPMAELRVCLAEAGYEDVETHIQTGNVKVRTRTRSAAKVEADLERLLADTFGFEIPAIVFTPAELRQVYDDAEAFTPHGDVQGERRYVSLFKREDVPTPEEAAAIDAWDAPGEAARLVGRAVHLWVDSSYLDAKMLTAFRKPLAPGTNRNTTVLSAVAAKWAAPA